jgi:hypothetical protein
MLLTQLKRLGFKDINTVKGAIDTLLGLHDKCFEMEQENKMLKAKEKVIQCEVERLYKKYG